MYIHTEHVWRNCLSSNLIPRFCCCLLWDTVNIILIHGFFWRGGGKFIFSLPTGLVYQSLPSKGNIIFRKKGILAFLSSQTSYRPGQRKYGELPPSTPLCNVFQWRDVSTVFSSRHLSHIFAGIYGPGTGTMSPSCTRNGVLGLEAALTNPMIIQVSTLKSSTISLLKVSCSSIYKREGESLEGGKGSNHEIRKYSSNELAILFL